MAIEMTNIDTGEKIVLTGEEELKHVYFEAASNAYDRMVCLGDIPNDEALEESVVSELMYEKYEERFMEKGWLEEFHEFLEFNLGL